MDIFLAGCVGCVSALAIAEQISEIREDDRKFKEVTNAKVYFPDRLVRAFNNPEFLSKAARNPENSDEYIIKAFVQGTVTCKNPIRSTINKQDKLVYSKYYREDVYSNLNTLTQELYQMTHTGKNAEVRAPLYFAIADPNTNQECIVHRSMEVDPHNSLTPIAEKTELFDLGPFERFLVFLGMIAEFFRKHDGDRPWFRGIRIGWTEKEFGIKVQNGLTVFGEVIFNTKENKIRIDTPLHFLHEKSQVLDDIQVSMGLQMAKAGFWMLPLAISVYYLVRKIVTYNEEKKKKELAQLNDRLAKVKSISITGGYRCVACVLRPVNVILKPCLHLCYCITCYKERGIQRCPICSVMTTDFVEIFFP